MSHYAYHQVPPAYTVPQQQGFDYRTPPVSPPPANGHGYYARYSVNAATPSPRGSPKVHARRSSTHDPYGYAYGAHRMPNYPGYPSPRTHQSQQSTPQRQADYVSGDYDRVRSNMRRSRAPDGKRTTRTAYGTTDPYASYKSAHRQYVYNVVVDDDDYQYRNPPPPYHTYEQYKPYDPYYSYWYTDQHAYDQVPVYTEAEQPTAHRTRSRRASASSRPHPTPPKARPTTATKAAAPKATEEDARRAGIPAGYSYKNWDPTEEPILLLGSVFDANSLGKWIYDWTVFHYGPATPMADVAGDLWLLLIQLAGKVKRADEIMPKIRKEENREMVEDFLDSGERLWIRFKKLLKICEDYMWKAAQQESGGKKPVQMGKNSGCEFVDSIFGRDRELDKTEKLMSAVRLWSMRFDANCEEILRYPSA